MAWPPAFVRDAYLNLVPSAARAGAGITRIAVLPEEFPPCAFTVSVSGGLVTVPEVAVTLVEPGPTALASPLAAMVATPLVAEAQVTLLVIFWVLLSLYVPVAVSWSVPPTTTEDAAAVTAIDVSVGAPFTVSE